MKMKMKRHLTYKNCMYASFVAIPIVLLFFYGIDNTNWDYFKKGRFITNTEGWQYRYAGVVYHYGLMVSEPAAIVIVSLTLGMISWIAHEGIMAVRNHKK